MKKKEIIVGEQKIHVVVSQPEVLEYPRALVLVHGSWGAGWMWNVYVEFFVSKGWQVVTLDLRGHGKSGGTVEGALMGNYVDDIHTVVDELELEGPVIIGHSMGGLIALMYGAEHLTSAVISIDGSPSIEVQKESKEMKYPLSYMPMDAGMPADPQAAMMAFPDLKPEQLIMMKDMLGKESGVARSERKLGISVPKNQLDIPLLFVGAEKGVSVPFGIGVEKARAMAEYYDGDIFEIQEATHPGILVGEHAGKSAEVIERWLVEQDDFYHS